MRHNAAKNKQLRRRLYSIRVAPNDRNGMSPTESIPLMRRYDMGTLWSSRLELLVGSRVARVKRKRGEAKVLPNAGGTAGNGWKFLVPEFWILCGRAQLQILGLFFVYRDVRHRKLQISVLI